MTGAAVAALTSGGRKARNDGWQGVSLLDARGEFFRCKVMIKISLAEQHLSHGQILADGQSRMIPNHVRRCEQMQEID